jgi:hypothetical protein
MNMVQETKYLPGHVVQSGRGPDIPVGRTWNAQDEIEALKARVAALEAIPSVAAALAIERKKVGGELQ